MRDRFTGHHNSQLFLKVSQPCEGALFKIYRECKTGKFPMNKKYHHLVIDFKIHFVVLLLLTACGTEPKKNNKTTINNDNSQQSSSLAGATSSKQVLSHSLASNYQPTKISSQNTKAFSSTPSVNTTLNKQSSFSSVSSAANQSVVAVSALTLPLKTSAGISGVIKVTGNNGEIISPEGVIVNLEPTNTMNEVVADQKERQHSVQMKDKIYAPKLITIKQNDQVNFANNDKIKHNVFSTSGENRFDLGTYGEGKTNKVAFKFPGIVKVYCNIHPEMALFISVSQHNYSHITDKNGFFEINNLPPGEYQLTAWHIRGETKQVVNLQGLRTKKDIVINTESYVPTPHKNKYGEAYKVKSALFEDEFY